MSTTSQMYAYDHIGFQNSLHTHLLHPSLCTSTLYTGDWKKIQKDWSIVFGINNNLKRELSLFLSLFILLFISQEDINDIKHQTHPMQNVPSFYKYNDMIIYTVLGHSVESTVYYNSNIIRINRLDP